MKPLSAIDWSWHQFQQLSVVQLYQMLKLRQEVFIIEQQCLYPDIDGLDQKCLHLLGYEAEQLVAYLRLIPAAYHDSGNMALGRIISSPSKRGTGIGKALMQQAIQFSAEKFTSQKIQISAQYYLVDFYQNIGFEIISEPYDDDGILHIDMLFVHRHER